MLFSQGQPTFIAAMRLKLGIHQYQQAADLSRNPRSHCKHEAVESPEVDRRPPHHL